MPDDKFADLMSAHLDETASEEQQVALLKLLEESEDLRQQAATHAFVERMALESIKKPLSTENIMRALPSKRDSKMALKVLQKTAAYEASKSAKFARMRRRTFIAGAGALATAAAIALVVGFWLIPNSATNAIATVNSVHSGEAWLESQGSANTRQKIMVGTKLQLGDRIVLGAKTEIRFSYAGEPTQIQLLENSTLEFPSTTPSHPKGGGKKIRLVKGNLKANVAPQPKNRPLIISTPHASMTVLGTIFTIDVASDQSKLSVEKGRVRIQSIAGGDGQIIEKNEWASATNTAKGILVPGRSLKWYSLRKSNIPKENWPTSGAAFSKSGLWVVGLDGTTAYLFNELKSLKSAPIKLERALFERTELSFYDGLLWGIARENRNSLLGFDASGKLIKRITLSEKLQKTFDIRGTAQEWHAFDFGNGFLWVAHNRKIYQIDPSDGTLIKTLEPTAHDKSSIHIATWCNDSLYLGTAGTFYRIDPSDGKVITSFSSYYSSSAARATAGENNTLWIYHFTHMQIHQLATDQTSYSAQPSK